MKTIIYTAPFTLKHDTMEGHPESPKRIRVLMDLFEDHPFCNWPQIENDIEATPEQIAFAHTEDYIFKLQSSTADHHQMMDQDTVLSPNSYEAALHAAGTICRAVDEVLEHDASEQVRAFCATRPPGHHAEKDRAMGFCLFNNIFIAARHAQEKHGLKKIAIIDFDVHHGNGTDSLVRTHNHAYPQKPIFYASTHAHPQWPMTGDPAYNNDLIHNVRLDLKSDAHDFERAYHSEILPAIDRFAPELILVSAGFDGHRDDPLAELRLIEDDFNWITTKLCALANKHCKGKLVSALEGGYNLKALHDSVKTHLFALNRVGL